MDEISVGNEGEDVANNFHWKIQQREMPAHLHQFARGKREEVKEAKMRRRWLAVSVNNPSLHFDI